MNDPAGTIQRRSRRKWRWPRFAAIGLWSSWPSSSRFIPTRSGSGERSCFERAAEVFAATADKRDAGVDVKTLHAKIGQPALDNDFLSGALGRIGDASAKR